MRHKSRLVALILTLCMAVGLGVAPKAIAAQAPFQDLKGSPYEAVVSTLWDYGIVTGLEADKYVPSGAVTRAQMAALIIRAMGKTQEAEAAQAIPNEFTDVPANYWARGVITLANRAGIVKGDGSKFFPNDPVNYAQVATMLVRALGYENQVTAGYPAGYVLKANELGLLTDLNFELYGGVNRGEAARFLYNAVFRAPDAQTGLTWSQSIFKRPDTLSMLELPTYAAPGQQIPLSATAKDPVGKAIPNVAVTYAVTGGSGDIQGNVLTVKDGGTITVRATAGALTATGTVTPISALAVTPDTFQANKGGTIQLTATGVSGGRQVSVQPQWKVTGPGTISDQGLLTVTDYGAISVEATLGTLRATATGQAVGKVTITNKPDYLLPGLTYALTASVTDSKGQPINVPATWSATGATIDSTSGRLTNAVGNQVTVRVTAGGITDEATLPIIKSIAVTPNNPTILRGKTVQFAAEGVDSAGKHYPIDVRWDRVNPSAGVVGADGVFVGTASGSTAITATAGNLQGRTTVQIGGDPARIALSAANTTLPTGGGANTTITIQLMDQTGALSPVSDQPITLVLTDAGGGTLSRTVVLTQDGQATVTYTTGHAGGNATISATAPGLSVSSQVLVISTYTPNPSYIQLTANPQPLAVGGGVATIAATLMDSNNYPATASQALYITLTASGTYLGGLTGTTITIPAGQSSGSTSFISSSVPGTIQISGTSGSAYQVRPLSFQTAAVGAAAKVKIRPITGATPVTGLSSLRAQVEVQDATGTLRANDNSSQVQLSVTMPNAQGTAPQVLTATTTGGVATFQVPAYAVGTATLNAQLVGMTPAVTDTATADFVPGIFSSLKLTAQPSNLPADGIGQTQIVAEVVDRTGALVTSINPTVTFRKLVNGGATNAISDLTVPAVNGRAILTLQTTRLAGTDTWYASAPGLDTQNLATVTTSVTSGVANSLRAVVSSSYGVNSSSTLIVQVIDQQGNVVTSDSGRPIVATHSIAGVTINPAVAVTQNGVASFVISGSTTTSGVVTFSTTNLPIPSTQATVTFGTGSGSNPASAAYSLFASGSATSVHYGNSVTVWVRVMDNQGSLVTGDTGRVISATVSGGAYLSSTSATTTGGIATFTVTGTNAGSVTLTFASNGLPQPSTTMTILFTN